MDKNFKFIGDRIHATFRCEIFFKPPFNQVVMLDGYSKHKFHHEPLDKDKCLIGFVERIIANGYLEKTYYLAFYTNKNMGKDLDDLLLEINPNSIETKPKIQAIFPLIDYLKRIQEARDSGSPLRYVKPILRTVPHIYFEIKKGRFKSKQELADYCSALLAKGVPRGRVEGFYFAYLELESFPNEVVFSRKVVDTAENLAEKFNSN